MIQMTEKRKWTEPHKSVKEQRDIKIQAQILKENARNSPNSVKSIYVYIEEIQLTPGRSYAKDPCKVHGKSVERQRKEGPIV